MRASVYIIATALLIGNLLSAAEGAPAPVSRDMKDLRLLVTFDVESLQVSPSDPQSLSAWALLAARGYHVVGVVPKGDANLLFLERSNLPGAVITIPQVVRQSPEAAASLDAQLVELRRGVIMTAGAPPAAARPEAAK